MTEASVCLVFQAAPKNKSIGYRISLLGATVRLSWHNLAMGRWEFDDANQDFERVVERAETGEPQLILRDGQELVAVLGVDEYQRLIAQKQA